MLLRVTNRRVSHDDVTVQIAVTVGCAYISFFIAQYILGKYSMYGTERTYFFQRTAVRSISFFLDDVLDHSSKIRTRFIVQFQLSENHIYLYHDCYSFFARR
jgi:hypothetical protein